MRFIRILFVLVFAACRNSAVENVTDEKSLKEPLIKVNKTISETENEQINAFIKRREWKMTETGTGLRYMIYQAGYGIQGKDGLLAGITYEVSLLNGNVVYDQKKKPEEFKIGRDDVESGLHEALTYLKVGDKAKLIIPMHLAYGLAGDMNKIPPRSTLVYDIELHYLK